MQITLKIKRFDPARDKEAHFESYTVEAEPTDRLLDVLNTVKWHQDGTLAYRRSCGHGICGSDAMLINGRNRLACRELIKNLGGRITIEPLRGFKVIKDLVVDMDAFFAKYRGIKPYLQPGDPDPDKERRQSILQRERFDDTTKCILCACCTTACPSYWANPDYLGPAAIVQGHRFLFDSRDAAKEERLAILNGGDGVWRCRTIFNCVEACPRDIDVTRAIGEVKKALLTSKV
jgi:succinate dehydrogenase / fumarate reductase iron-sulfur subunit